MKKAFIIILALAIATAAVLGVKHFSKKKWEATLKGPYEGKANIAKITGSPFSSLVMPGGEVEIYYPANENNPVLVCRSDSGEIISQTSLIPSRTDEKDKVQTAYVKQLELRKPYSCTFHDCEGIHVLFRCDWEWGGKQGGLLTLNDDLTFKEMWLSW